MTYQLDSKLSRSSGHHGSFHTSPLTRCPLQAINVSYLEYLFLFVCALMEETKSDMFSGSMPIRHTTLKRYLNVFLSQQQLSYYVMFRLRWTWSPSNQQLIKVWYEHTCRRLQTNIWINVIVNSSINFDSTSPDSSELTCWKPASSIK